MIKKIILILVVLLLIVGGITVVRHKKEELAKTPLPEHALLTVKTVNVSYGTFEQKKRFLGTITPKISADIAARVTGHLMEVKVREGRHVNRGELLATLDNRLEQDRVNELAASLAAAKTEYATREAIYQRDRSLFSANAISREKLDLSHAARDSARARVTVLKKSLHTAKTNLSYTFLHAPFSGVITKRLKDPGDLALPGLPILSMEDPAKGYYVSVRIPQDLFPLLKVGDKAYILGENRKKIICSISRIHPAVHVGTLSTIEIDTEKRPFGLPSGATADVDIVVKRVEGWKVPVRTLLEDVNSTYVFTLDTGKHHNKGKKKTGTIHILKIDVLAKGPETAVITGRLKNNSTLIVAEESGLLRLHEGEEVRIED